MIVMSRKNMDYFSVFKNSKYFTKYVRKVNEDITRQHYLDIFKIVHVIYSDYAGLGKTTHIQQSIRATNSTKDIVVLFLNGELSFEVLKKRLFTLEKRLEKVESCCLHIKLDTLQELEHSNGIVDYLLYQVCVLRRVQTHRGCLDMQKIDKVYIEIGNTIGFIALVKKFSTLMLFDKNWHKMATFNSDNLIVNPSIKDPAQIVSFYLNAIQEKYIGQATINHFQVPHGVDEFKKIMKANFMKAEKIENRDKITYTQYSTWVKICYKLLSEFDRCKEMNPDFLGVDSVIRYEFGCLIRDFASKMIQFSVEQAKSSQVEFYDLKNNYSSSTNEDISAVHKKFEKMNKWDAKSNLIPVIYQGNFMVFYGSDDQFKDQKNLKYLVENKVAQIRGKAKVNNNTPLKSKEYLQIYDYLLNYSENFLYERSKRFPNLDENCDNEKGVEEGFVITEENNLKIALVLVKAMVGVPIVIMGESGCGKTYFTKYVASCIKKDEIRIITLHAGIKEEDLLVFLKECIAQALKFKTINNDKKLWILFDEFNTSPLQSIVAEIMQDKVCSVDPEIGMIPDNLVIVACCNPFQLREAKSELGLIPDTADNRLSHQVYVVLESLLNYVWDFGSLTEKDEKDHIFSIIGSETIFGENKNEEKDFLKNVVYQAHKFVRNYEKGGVSLRDIKRVVKLVKWASSYLMKVKELNKQAQIKIVDEKQAIILAVLVTVNICYGLRMNGSINQKTNKLIILDMYDEIFNKCITLLVKKNKDNYKPTKIMDLLDKIEKTFVEELQETSLNNQIIPQGIAPNKPLRENIFALFACYSTLTPLLICGKPGTSKTLCAQIFSTCMKKEFSDRILSLNNLPDSVELYYGGSQTSTDTGIEKVFDRADKIIESDKNIDDQEGKKSTRRPFILIDEIGLAELSPHRPLKILHPKLEKKDKAYFFLGVSNWALDLSKMNRVVYLARPDMSYEDLKDTFVAITGLTPDSCKGLMSNFIETYLAFRSWQMKYGIHRNFHGSRDIYSVFKHIKNRLSCLQETLTDENLLTILKESIERNFSGELYKIDDSNRLLGIAKATTDTDKTSANATAAAPKKKLTLRDRLNNKDAKPKDSPPVAAQPSPQKTADTQDLAVSDSAYQFEGNFLYNKQKELIYISGLSNLYKYQVRSQQQINNLSKFTYETSSQTFIRQLVTISPYLKTLAPQKIDEIYQCTPPLNHIKENLKSKDCRFLLLFTENPLIDSVLIQILRNEFEGNEIIDWRDNKLGSASANKDKSNNGMASGMKKAVNSGDEEKDESQIRTDKETVEMLSMMKTYIQTGKIVVMKGIDALYGSLYDLFNQKYIERDGEKWCYLYYGDEKPKAKVHPDFKCVVIIDEEQSRSLEESLQETNTGQGSANQDNLQPQNNEKNTRQSGELEIKQPAPFLNRFEKYRLKIADVLSEDQCNNLKEVLDTAIEMSNGLESRFTNLNIEMLSSIVVTRESISDQAKNFNPFEEVNDKITKSDYVKTLTKLTTSNYLFSQGADISKDIVVKFKEAHPYDNLSELIVEYDKNYSSLKKNCVFTFSSTFELDKFISNYEENDNQDLIRNWHVVTSHELLQIGTANRKKLIEDIFSRKKHLLIQFQKLSHYSMIPAIKTIIDNYLGLDQADFDFKNASKNQMFLQRNESRMSRTSNPDVNINNFNPGVILLLHLNESATYDLKNTGLSFWDCWNNWVIEDLTDSGYKQIEKYFFQTEVDDASGETVIVDDLDSVWQLLQNNQDLRFRVFEKLVLNVLINISDKHPELNFEAEMSQISILLQNSKTVYNIQGSGETQYLNFTAEFSSRIFNIEFIKNALSNKDLTNMVFSKCKMETNYYHYEEKLVQVIPAIVNDLLIKILVNLQKEFRLSSINNMFNIYNKKQGFGSEDGVKIFNLMFDQIQTVIDNVSAKGHNPVSDDYWKLLKNQKLNLKMPMIHYPVFGKELEEIIDLMLGGHEIIDSCVLEIKEMIRVMVDDENLSNDEEYLGKYDKLNVFIEDKIGEVYKEQIFRLEQGFKKVSLNSRSFKEFQQYIIYDLLNEYFRKKEKKSTRDLFSELVRDFLINYSVDDFTIAIKKVVVVIKVYDSNLLDINEMIYKMKVKIDLPKLLSDSEMDDEKCKLKIQTTRLFTLFKEMKNRVLIQLVFDSKDEKKGQIETILENIEIVEYLDFDSQSTAVEITTKENVKVYRILLNLLKLVLVCTEQPVDYLATQDKIRLQEIFEKSKQAFNPEKYRFNEFVKFFFGIIRTYIGELTHYQDSQDKLVNLINQFNCEIYSIFLRALDLFNQLQNSSSDNIAKQRQIYKNLFEELSATLLMFFTDPDLTNSLNGLIDEKILHKITNNTANQIYSLLDSNISEEISSSKIDRFFKFKPDSLIKSYVEFIEKEILRPNFPDIPTGEIAEKYKFNIDDNMSISLSKSICDVYTLNYEKIIGQIKTKSDKAIDKRLYRECLSLLQATISSFYKLPFGIKKFKQIAYIRAFLNSDFCANYGNFEYSNELNNILVEQYILAPGKHPEETFTAPSYIVIFYLMRNFDINLDCGLEDFEESFKGKRENYSLIQKYLEVTNPSKAKNPLVMKSQSKRTLQMKINKVYQTNKLNQKHNWLKTDVPEILLGGDQLGIVRYIIGIVLLNELTRTEEDPEVEQIQEGNQDLVGNVMQIGQAKKLKTKQFDLEYLQKFLLEDDFIKEQPVQWVMYLHTLVHRKYYHINTLSHLSNFDEYVKIILHFGLVVTSFNKTYSFYDADPLVKATISRKMELSDLTSATSVSIHSLTAQEAKSVKEGMKKKFVNNQEINLDIIHPFPEEERYSGLLSKMIFVYETRMKESGYETYYKDIGIYECSCGISYSLENCGMASVAGTCSKCKAPIGGTGHVHVAREGHMHYKDVESLKQRLLNLYNQQKGKYQGTRTLNFNSDDYKNYDYLEGQQDRVSRVLTHLFDHCYLLMYPIFNYDCKDQIDAVYKNFFKNDEMMSTLLKKMNNIQIQNCTDYFLAHIMFDIEQVMNGCNITIKNTIRLINEGIINIAEGLDEKKGLKSIIQNDLCGQDNMFGQTSKFLGLINKRLDEWNNEETNIKKMALDLSLQRLEKNEILAFFPQHFYNAQLFRCFPKRNIVELFESEINKIDSQRDYDFLSYFYNVKEVLPHYRDIVYSHLELVNFMNTNFNGQFTKEEARQTMLIDLINNPENNGLKEVYLRFQHQWRNVIPKIKDKHSTMFNIAFMCQRNLDPDAYFKKLTKPEELTVMDVVLINTDTNEGIYLLGTLQTLLKWQQEMLNKARFSINRPVCRTKNAQYCKPEELIGPIDQFSDILVNNAFYNLQFNNENMVRFNLHNIQQTIAERVSEDQTILRFEKDIEDCISFFVFKGENSEEEKILLKVIPRIEKVRMDRDFKDMFLGLREEELKQIKTLISSICVLLFNKVLYDCDITIKELHQKCDFRGIRLKHVDESLIQNIKLGHMSEILDLVRIKNVDTQLEEYKNELSEPMSQDLANIITNWFLDSPDMRNTRPISDRILDIIQEVKIGLDGCFKDSSNLKYLISGTMDLLDLISITVDEEFSEFLTGSEIDTVKSTQVIDFIRVLMKVHDDSI